MWFYQLLFTIIPIIYIFVNNLSANLINISHLLFTINMLFGIILFASTTLFSFITLPVEINASNRALAWLQSTGLTTQQNDAAAKEALTSAAYTYVVAALSSLATLIYYVMIYMGRRD